GHRLVAYVPAGLEAASRCCNAPACRLTKQPCERVRANVVVRRKRPRRAQGPPRSWSHPVARATVSLALVALTLIPVAFPPHKREQSRPQESDQDSAPIPVH